MAGCKFIVTLSAERLVFLQFAEHNLLFALYNTVTDVGKVATAHTNGMNLRHILGNGTKRRHRSKRIALEIHVKASNDDPLSSIGQLIADFHETLVEELCLVDAYNICLGRK